MADRSKFLKAFDVLGIFIAASVVLAWMYGMQVRNWHRARNMQKAERVLSLVPQPLPDISAARAKGLTLAAFGYQFDVPWTEITAHRSDSTLAVYAFAGGRGLTISNPATFKNIVEIPRDPAQQSRRWFTNFLGARTEYDLLSSELGTTPAQLSPFMSKSESFRRATLLNMKETELTRKPSAIYSFSGNALRGFQLGDPRKDRRVEIRAFDGNDRELRMMLGADPHSNVKLEQSEINQVLQSLRRAAEREDENRGAQLKSR